MLYIHTHIYIYIHIYVSHLDRGLLNNSHLHLSPNSKITSLIVTRGQVHALSALLSSQGKCLSSLDCIITEHGAQWHCLPFLKNLFNWRLITFQYCRGFCHTVTWISHGCTCVPHPEPPSHLPPHPIPQGHPSAPALSTLTHASNVH